MNSSVRGARGLDLGKLFFEFGLARGGKPSKDVRIHGELAVRLEPGNSFEDGPRWLIQDSAPAINAIFEIDVYGKHLSPRFESVPHGCFIDVRAAADIFRKLPAAKF